MRRAPLALALTSLLVASLAVAQAASPAVSPAVSPTSLRPVIEARYPEVRWIDVATLGRWLAGERPVVLLDARQPAEFAVSHLEGARRVDPDAPDVAGLGLARDARVVVYCSVGWRSASVADALRRAGYGDVHNLEGGIFAWANEGRPVSRDGRRVRAVHPYDETWGRMLRAPLRRYRP